MYRIKNWRTWQSYRSDRPPPPWIKLHRCVMRNPEWVSLTDAERGQLVSLWLLAADKEGVLPDIILIKKMCHLSSPINLAKFLAMGFVEENDAKMTPSGCQDDAKTTQQSRVDKNRVDKKGAYTDTVSDKGKEKEKDIPPKIEEVIAYCKERGGQVDSNRWYNHYQAKGWFIGKNKMKDWKAAVRTWEPKESKSTSDGGFAERHAKEQAEIKAIRQKIKEKHEDTERNNTVI